MVHRGAPGPGADLVENTTAAFQRAYDVGFRYFETDLHCTRDGVVVVSHDDSLRRVAGERVKISSVDWEELATVAVGGAPLPRLHELLEAFPDVCFNVDPKADATVRPLVDLLRSTDVLSRVCVASFSDRRLRWVRVALGSDVCTAAGPGELRSAMRQVVRGVEVDLPGVDVIQIPRLLARRSGGRLRDRTDLVSGAQRVGLPVHVWTVNDGDDMRRLLHQGVDGVMSDDVGTLARVFSERGWRPAD
jgi:glycerophosphoryl diester phosphodiesterase